MQEKSKWRFDSGWFNFLGLLGLVGLFVERLSWMQIFLIFFAIPLVWNLFRGGSDGERSQPPLPPPAGSATRMTLRFLTSQMAVVINPFQLAQILLQTVGQVWVMIRTLGRLPVPETFQSQVSYTLPVTGTWYVYNGGITPETSHSWSIVTQRYAYDLVQADDQLVRHSTDGKSFTDYRCYGQPIVAAAPGTVVAVRDGIRDATDVGTGWLDILTRDFRGNHVVIRHAENEYSFLAHLVPGSITVTKGEQVERGQLLGRCGNSGYSTEPHLHFHVQDRANMWFAAGLPVQFTDLAVDGDPADGPTYIQGGTFVSSLAERETLNDSRAPRS